MSVDLCGLQAGVSQQLLHHPQVGPPVQEVGGEAVAEGVGVGGARRPAVVALALDPEAITPRTTLSALRAGTG